MDEWSKIPDSTHGARDVLVPVGLGATGKELGPRLSRRPVGRLGRTIVVVCRKTTDCVSAKPQFVQFILAGQIPVAAAAQSASSARHRRSPSAPARAAARAPCRAPN